MDGLRSPERIGLLGEEDMQDLWSIFDFIGTQWGTWQDCQITTVYDLKPIIDLKTSKKPSYLTEYQEALVLFRNRRSEEDEEKALRWLFSLEATSPVQQYVLAEFIKLHVAQGGFRTFGYVNYQGYMRGTFNNHARLPYRDARPLVEATEEE
jgi:hypothetical protein